MPTVAAVLDTEHPARADLVGLPQVMERPIRWMRALIAYLGRVERVHVVLKLSPEGAVCRCYATPIQPLTCGCGPKGIRTPDLLAASQALYQLSYGPGEAEFIGRMKPRPALPSRAEVRRATAVRGRRRRVPRVRTRGPRRRCSRGATSPRHPHLPGAPGDVQLFPERALDLVDDRLDLTRGSRGADHEVIGDHDQLAHVQDDDVLRLLG